MEVLDARGLSCPEPVIMIKKAMESKAAAYKLLTDNHAAKENVSRYAEHEGYQVKVTEADGEYMLEITR